MFCTGKRGGLFVIVQQLEDMQNASANEGPAVPHKEDQ